MRRKKEGKEEGNKKEKRLKKTVKGNQFWLSSYLSLFLRERPLSFVERDKNNSIKLTWLFGSEFRNWQVYAASAHQNSVLKPKR
ncbi:hypothetical protein [Methanosarcina sp. 1.H.T.1A.1]|uniref:hypothetical protein n=1 Tax=Methanosarcina sp. 1.H.T.1A.1 TaxID=1483602 RepID=UPI00138E3518|nr:hypothetical protein [Methanosarcina sp. 1.H.T.1A.1]